MSMTQDDKTKRKTHDIYLRLPPDKEHLKIELKYLASRNNVSMTTLLIWAIEFYLGKRDRRPIQG